MLQKKVTYPKKKERKRQHRATLCCCSCYLRPSIPRHAKQKYCVKLGQYIFSESRKKKGPLNAMQPFTKLSTKTLSFLKSSRPFEKTSSYCPWHVEHSKLQCVIIHFKKYKSTCYTGNQRGWIDTGIVVKKKKKVIVCHQISAAWS